MPFAGCTESYRGYDGVRTIVAAIEKAGKADPEAIRAAFWEVEVNGMNGKIKFNKAGPAGKESGRSSSRTSTSCASRARKVVVPQS